MEQKLNDDQTDEKQPGPDCIDGILTGGRCGGGRKKEMKVIGDVVHGQAVAKVGGKHVHTPHTPRLRQRSESSAD